MFPDPERGSRENKKAYGENNGAVTVLPIVMETVKKDNLLKKNNLRIKTGLSLIKDNMFNFL